MRSDERLAVSTAGMRELHAGRPAWSLAKELVQNAWDEAPETTTCHVTVSKLDSVGLRRTLLVVEDDGPGFANIEDAYTLMGHTPKRSDSTKRGRFNIGEKEIVSVALEGSIETIGKSVIFPPDGGRVLKRNYRKRGTVVRLVLPWTSRERLQLIDMLRRFRPSDCKLYVNAEEVPERLALVSHETTLRTVLQSGQGEPMRGTSRKTTIDILRPDGESWLYEMGIPVQRTDIGFDVDVQQKVPMPPNRDTVSKSYLQDIASEVLNATHELMDGEQFADTWVRTALEDERVTKPAVVTAVRKRYGDKVAMWSSNVDANMDAAERGYEVLHPRSMSPEERNAVRQLGGVQSTNDLFGLPKIGGGPPVDLPPMNDVRWAWRDFVIETGRLLGLDAQVVFVNEPTGVRASCTADSDTPLMTFNVRWLSNTWLSERGEDQYELLVHEFGHAVARKAMAHGPEWGRACCRVAGRLAATGLGE